MAEVHVRSDGCVQLGGKVTCDGFAPGVPIRIQSHAHVDHLKDFDTSKGYQEHIVMAEETKDLLIAETREDLLYRRTQVVPLPCDGNSRRILDTDIALYPSAHIVGGAIASVKYADGQHYVYAPDFSWPLENLPQCPDVMVVDATYGDPACIRNYNEQMVVDRFIEIARDMIREGSILITGFKGRLQFAAQLLTTLTTGPFIFSKSVYRTLPVFMKYRGFHIHGYRLGGDESRRIIRSGGKYVAFAELKDRVEVDQLKPKYRMLLSAFMVPKQEPVMQHRDGLTRIALTDHADFQGTIELIRTINPKKLIANATMGGNGQALAEYVKNELSIPATSQTMPTSLEWGKH